MSTTVAIVISPLQETHQNSRRTQLESVYHQVVVLFMDWGASHWRGWDYFGVMAGSVSGSAGH